MQLFLLVMFKYEILMLIYKRILEHCKALTLCSQQLEWDFKLDGMDY
jgi:hypothetical protein